MDDVTTLLQTLTQIDLSYPADVPQYAGLTRQRWGQQMTAVVVCAARVSSEVRSSCGPIH